MVSCVMPCTPAVVGGIVMGDGGGGGSVCFFFDKRQILLAAKCCNYGDRVTSYRLQSYPSRTTVHMVGISTSDLHLMTI